MWLDKYLVFCMVHVVQQHIQRPKYMNSINKTVEIIPTLFETYQKDAFIKVMKIRHENSMIRGKSNIFTAFKDFENKVNLNSKSYMSILSDYKDWISLKEDKILKNAEVIENMVKKSKRVLILETECSR